MIRIYLYQTINILFLPLCLFYFPWFLEQHSQKGLQFGLTCIITVGLIQNIVSLIFVCKWTLLRYKKELLKSTYELIPRLPRDILNRRSPVFFLSHQICCIQRYQCQYDHTPIPCLSIGTIRPEDLLTQQTGIITSHCQYFHLNVLPNSKFSYQLFLICQG